MNILAFGDVHEQAAALKKIEERAKDADILICTGDLSDWGSRTNKMIERLAKLEKPLLIIHGNHEGEKNMKEACQKHKKINFLHRTWHQEGKYFIFGYGGGGFAFENPDFERSFRLFAKNIKKEHTVIVLTHGPPYGTKLDYLPNLGHRGCKTMRKILDEFKPVLWICGHLHENMGKMEVLHKQVVVVNPGAEGKLIKI